MFNAWSWTKTTTLMMRCLRIFDFYWFLMTKGSYNWVGEVKYDEFIIYIYMIIRIRLYRYMYTQLWLIAIDQGWLLINIARDTDIVMCTWWQHWMVTALIMEEGENDWYRSFKEKGSRRWLMTGRMTTTMKSNNDVESIMSFHVISSLLTARDPEWFPLGRRRPRAGGRECSATTSS